MTIYRDNQFPSHYHDKLFHVLFGLTHTSEPYEHGKRVQIFHLEGQGQETSVEFEDFAVWEFDGGFPHNPVDITEGPDGSLYVTDIFQEKIFRIYYEP